MKRRMFVLAIALIAMMTATTLFATNAQDVVQQPCNINVSDAMIEELVLTMFEGTGVKVVFECVLPDASVSTMRQDDDKMCDVLDSLLRGRGYCWRTLGSRLFITRQVVTHGVGGGQGYIRNITTGETIIFEHSAIRAEESAARQQAAEAAFALAEQKRIEGEKERQHAEAGARALADLGERKAEAQATKTAESEYQSAMSKWKSDLWFVKTEIHGLTLPGMKPTPGRLQDAQKRYFELLENRPEPSQ